LLKAKFTAEKFWLTTMEAHVTIENDFVDKAFRTKIAFVRAVAGKIRKMILII
jgi:hypothetical protein